MVRGQCDDVAGIAARGHGVAGFMRGGEAQPGDLRVPQDFAMALNAGDAGKTDARIWRTAAA